MPRRSGTTCFISKSLAPKSTLKTLGNTSLDGFDPGISNAFQLGFLLLLSAAGIAGLLAVAGKFSAEDIIGSCQLAVLRLGGLGFPRAAGLCYFVGILRCPARVVRTEERQPPPRVDLFMVLSWGRTGRPGFLQIFQFF